MDLVLRAIILFAAVFVLLRVIDRRELAEMEPFDFILLIVLGDATQPTTVCRPASAVIVISAPLTE